jgi:hypothetical protein
MERFGHIACETMHYGAYDSGTRTIYATKVPLWEETVRSGHPLLGEESPPRFTAWPDKLPASLPAGAVAMDDSDPYFGAWVNFGANEIEAFEFCEPNRTS